MVSDISPVLKFLDTDGIYKPLGFGSVANLSWRYAFQVTRVTDVDIPAGGVYQVEYESSLSYDGKLPMDWNAAGIVIPEDGLWQARTRIDYATPDANTVVLLQIMVHRSGVWVANTAICPATHPAIGGHANEQQFGSNFNAKAGDVVAVRLSYLGPGVGSLKYTSVNLMGPV